MPLGPAVAGGAAAGREGAFDVSVSVFVCMCVYLWEEKEKDGAQAGRRVTEVQVAQFQVPTVYYNGILIYCNFSGYFNPLIIFSLSCTETRASFIISSPVIPLE